MRLGGGLPVATVDTDLQNVCEEVLLEIQASYPDRLVRFDCSGDVRGTWDPDRLAQAVRTLADPSAV